jgi:hypothetical protein
MINDILFVLLGHHPWSTHHISIPAPLPSPSSSSPHPAQSEPPLPSKEEHYTSLLPPPILNLPSSSPLSRHLTHPSSPPSNASARSARFPSYKPPIPASTPVRAFFFLDLLGFLSNITPDVTFPQAWRSRHRQGRPHSLPSVVSRGSSNSSSSGGGRMLGRRLDSGSEEGRLGMGRWRGSGAREGMRR